MKKRVFASIVAAILLIVGIAIAADLQPIAVTFIGRWQPTDDAVLIDEHGLQDIQNLRKSGKHFKGISGHSVINATSLSATPYFLNGFHFVKSTPAESHVIVAAADTASPTASHLFQNTTAIPNAGLFSATTLHTDAAGGIGAGRFSLAPNGNMVYCNGPETLIWGGNEILPTAFITAASTLSGTASVLSNPNDYTSQVRNNRTTADQVAIVGGGIDDNTLLLLHGNGTDGSTTITASETTAHSVTAAGSAAIDTAQYKYMTGSILFGGTTADYVYTPDSADWNMADGTFTYDFWVRFAALPATGTRAILFSQTSTANAMAFSMGYAAADDGSEYPTAHSDDYVLATSSLSTTTNAPYFATDPTKALDGAASTKSWLSAESTVTNQRFHIDLGSAKTVERLYYENYHDSGTDTDKGVQNFTLWGSNGTGIMASGGSITTSGDYIIHTFTSTGTFTPTANLTVEVLVVGGGGAGGGQYGGGGGGGGVRSDSAYSVTASTDYTVTVGAGGLGDSLDTKQGDSGGVSSFNTDAAGGGAKFESAGGGGGGSYSASYKTGVAGGSGGGGATAVSSNGAGGSGNTPSTTPSQGAGGGIGTTDGATYRNGGGGGGGGESGKTGSNGASKNGGAGGAGTASSISGASVTYGGGGGGYAWAGGTAGAGGSGGGGTGGVDSGAEATSGTNGLGGGGGGGNSDGPGGSGGSGVVIVRYLINSNFLDTTYATDTNWTQLSTSQNSFDQHSASDAADPKYITVTNDTAYRYYAIKFSNNYGDAGGMGLRRVTLMTEAEAAYTDFTLSLTTSSSEVKPIDAKKTSSALEVDTWYHIAVIRGWAGNGDVWTVTVDGNSIGTNTLTTTYPDIAAVLKIGAGADSGLDGWIDEFRISKGVARWTSNFTPYVTPYRTTQPAWFVGFPRPVQGVKFYISYANGATSSLTASEWNGSSWSALSVTDNTKVSGATMAQTGTVTFSSTVDSAKQRYIHGYALYWYQFSMDAGQATIYYVTGDAPMQPIRNIWDGSAAYVTKATVYSGTAYEDYTDNVNDQAPSTTMVLSSLSTSGYVLCGFTQAMQALTITFDATKENATSGTTMSGYYWDGQEWIALPAMNDGTATDTTSLAKNGTVSWQSPGAGVEFPTAIGDETPMFYYKLSFAKAPDSETEIGEIRGVTAPNPIGTYKFSEVYQNHLFLFNEYNGLKNKAIYSMEAAPDIFNGAYTGTFYFGDDTDIVAAANVYNVFGNSAYDQLIVGKRSEIYRLSGDYPSAWTSKRISSTVGCAAPLSMVSAVAHGLTEDDNPKNVVIWQGDEGFYMTDGATVTPISEDIKVYFDKNDSRCIPTTRLTKTVAWYDPSIPAYKALISSGATATYHNVELEYSLKHREWTKIDRVDASGSDPLQCGFRVFNTDGIGYTYGGNTKGFLYRLEYGATFNGTAIEQMLWTKDMILDTEAPLFRKSTIKHLRTALKKKTNGGTVTVAHYGDKVLTVDGTSNQAVPDAINMATAHYNTQSCNLGPFLYHSLKYTLSGSTVADGMELIGLGIWSEPYTALR